MYFSRAYNASGKLLVTMAETLLEEGECSRKRIETQIIVHQLPRPISARLKLLLASTIVLVVVVFGAIVYFIYAKYAYEWQHGELPASWDQRLFTSTSKHFCIIFWHSIILLLFYPDPWK